MPGSALFHARLDRREGRSQRPVKGIEGRWASSLQMLTSRHAHIEKTHPPIHPNDTIFRPAPILSQYNSIALSSLPLVNRMKD